MSEPELLSQVVQSLKELDNMSGNNVFENKEAAKEVMSQKDESKEQLTTPQSVEYQEMQDAVSTQEMATAVESILQIKEPPEKSDCSSTSTSLEDMCTSPLVESVDPVASPCSPAQLDSTVHVASCEITPMMECLPDEEQSLLPPPPPPPTPIHHHDSTSVHDIPSESQLDALSQSESSSHPEQSQQTPSKADSSQFNVTEMISVDQLNVEPEINLNSPLLNDPVQQSLAGSGEDENFDILHSDKDYSPPTVDGNHSQEQLSADGDSTAKVDAEQPISDDSKPGPLAVKRKLSPTTSSSAKKHHVLDTHESENIDLVSTQSDNETSEDHDTLIDFTEDVADTLKTLQVICSNEVNKDFVTKLHDDLSAAISKNQAESVIKYTVDFVSSLTANSWTDYSVEAKAHELLLVEEMAIVEACATLDVTFIKQLLQAIAAKVVESDVTLPGSASLCRVFSFLAFKTTSTEEVKELCCSLCYNCPKYAPYLIANIILVYPDVWKTFPESGAGKFLLSVIKYLLSNKPNDLNDDVWVQACSVLQHHLDQSDVSTPSIIINSILEHIIDASSIEMFSDEDVKQYIFTFQLLTSHLDWDWLFSNLIQPKLYPVIEKYSWCSSLFMKNSSAIALLFKLLCVLGQSSSESYHCLNFVKNCIQKIINQRTEVYLYILKEAYLAQYYLHLHHHKTVDEDVLGWLKQHEFEVSP